MNVDRVPPVEALRQFTTEDLRTMRTEVAVVVGELSQALKAPHRGGTDPAWEGRVRVKKSALESGIRNIKNVLAERGVGIPQQGSALPSLESVSAHLGHVGRLVRAMSDLLNACRCLVDSDDEADGSFENMEQALTEIEARMADWAPTSAPTAQADEALRCCVAADS